MNAVGILLGVSAGIILLCMITGAILLSQDRASATDIIRLRELNEAESQKARRRGGGYVGEIRLDRSRWYVWLQVGLLMVGQGIVLRPTPAGVLASLGATSNDLLGMTMVLGSMFSLVGSAIGLPWCLPNESDLRIPHALGFFGQFAVLNSIAAYALIITLHSDLIGTLGGGLAIVIAAASAQQLWCFARDIYLRTKILIRLRNEH